MTSMDSIILIFCVEVHTGLDPPTPVHMHPPEPDPLRVDVINGWPHSCLYMKGRNTALCSEAEKKNQCCGGYCCHLPSSRKTCASSSVAWSIRVFTKATDCIV